MSDLDGLLAFFGRGKHEELLPLVRCLLQLDDRLTRLERGLLIVDDLPASAPFGALLRLRGDLTGSLYLGNGATRPLSKLVPVAV